MKIKFTIILLLFTCLHLKAQSNDVKVTINCYDEDSNDIINFYTKVIQVDSTSPELNKRNYQLKPGVEYTLVISRFGYITARIKFKLVDEIVLNITLKEKAIEQSGSVAKSTRVDKNSAFAYTDISGKQLKTQNLGQDFTYLMANTPSAVTTSDAGAGVGYTGIRIRGSDATRINVTINGIPINDAESHGVFWVNMPDLASSTNNVQVQRGVGTSTNGNGSFGANISVNNIENSNLPGLWLQQSYGSFNTSKSTMKFSTGKMGDFTFSGRISKITSNGYLDRAASDLSSFQFNLNYYKNKWAVNALSFGGKEKTYQAWNGTPQSRYNNNRDSMQAYSDRNYLSIKDQNNLFNSGRTYNSFTYKNQTDNYWQNHYQLHIGRELGKFMMVKSSFYTTTGKGYYEEYKNNDGLKKYGVSDYISPKGDTTSATDLIRQKWLDNIYYGNFTSLDYAKNKLKINAGFGVTSYHGKHFGKVIWAEMAQQFGNDYEYYRAKSTKNEINGFAKGAYQVTKKLSLMAELQVRKINYSSTGISSDLTIVKFDQNYSFFNPKAGFNYQVTKNHQIYGSYSIGNREPVRSDFTDNTDSTIPKAEQLKDLEFGWIKKGRSHFIQVNAYYMNYINQLVLTGDVNDVGTGLRKNVKESYRKGLELIGMKSIFRGKTILEGNLTLSQNKIKNFQDVYYNYHYFYDTVTAVKVNYQNTNIAFSPNVIAYLGITDKHIRNFQIGVNMKYVGKQYLDNTSDKDAKLAAYSTINVHFQKAFAIKNVQSLVVKGMINNLGSINYTNNGYTYKYVSAGYLIKENFYFPQSLINFMLGVELKF